MGKTDYGALAAGIAEKVRPGLNEAEQAMFIAGFTECAKYMAGPKKLEVEYAGAWYEVAELRHEFGIQWVAIYDEPPNLHVDRVQLSHTTGIRYDNEKEIG